jgi:hypothetical protein
MLSKKGLRSRANSDSCMGGGRRFGDDGRQDRDQGQLFYEFSVDEMADHHDRHRPVTMSASGGRSEVMGRPSK